MKQFKIKGSESRFLFKVLQRLILKGMTIWLQNHDILHTSPKCNTKTSKSSHKRK